jgi:hypothetical protein
MRTALLLSLGLLIAACDDDGPGSPATCQLACERAAACSAPADRRACASSCGGPAYPEPALSPRYLDAVRRCLAAVPCSSAELYGAGEECAQQEALRLKPSKPAEDLCRRALSADRYCGGLTLGDYDCLERVKIYDDAMLRRAARCYDGPCSTQGACVDDLFGYYGYPRNPYD